MLDDYNTADSSGAILTDAPQQVDASAAANTEQCTSVVVLETTCTARPGLQTDIWKLLEQLNVVQIRVSARVYEAPMCNTLVCQTTLALGVPSSLHGADVADALETLDPDLIATLH